MWLAADTPAPHAEPTQPAQPAAAVTPQKPRIAIVGLRNDGVDDAVVRQVVDGLAHEMQKDRRVEVLTVTEIQAVLGLEATKQAMDCDGSTCAAMEQITDALDVRFLVAGSVGPVGEKLHVTTSLVDVQNGAVVARAVADFGHDAMGTALTAPAQELLTAIGAATPDQVDAAPPLPVLSAIGVAIGGIGLAAAATGAILWGIDHNTISSTETAFDDKEDARGRYIIDQAVTAGGAAVFALGIGVAVVALLVTGEDA